MSRGCGRAPGSGDGALSLCPRGGVGGTLIAGTRMQCEQSLHAVELLLTETKDLCRPGKCPDALGYLKSVYIRNQRGKEHGMPWKSHWLPLEISLKKG